MSSSVFIRPAVRGDGKALAPCLRTADQQELAASHPGQRVEDCLEHFCAISVQSVCLCTPTKRLALGGIYSPIMLGNQACVWLLTGQDVERYKYAFVRLARKQLRTWLQIYPVLENEVDARYRAAHHLIKHLGGQIHTSISWKKNIPFLYVTFRRNQWEEL